jgi:hypothetical protein
MLRWLLWMLISQSYTLLVLDSLRIDLHVSEYT